jgi:hypothetical protein
MAFRLIFSHSELASILSRRGYVFLIDGNYAVPGFVGASNREWSENRLQRQKELLGLIEARPLLFDLVYKLLDFVIKDKKFFKLKCSSGSDNKESTNWDQRHRCDRILGVKKKKKELSLEKKEFENFLRHFFLAAPELFIENRMADGRNFFIKPKDYDILYFLSATSDELADLYEGLKTEDSVFLHGWLELLS